MRLGGLGPLQPYFVEYCREKSLITREDMTTARTVDHFVLWIGRKWMQWREENKNHRELSDADHANFAAWLPIAVDAEIKSITEIPELNCRECVGK